MAGIYLHIPFCKQACHYCDFHFSTVLTNKEAVINALSTELTLRKAEITSAETIETIYFGGGTPSLLSEAELNSLLQTIHSNFSVAPDAEITLEANPDDLLLPKLREFKNAGVNRLSIGIQSFHDAHLTFMNRAHTALEAHKSIDHAHSLGFNNLSLDLIFGIPADTDGFLKEDLKHFFELQPNHISAYGLTIEEKTPFGKWTEKGKMAPIDEDFTARQFDIVMEQMEANGYEQYEISNFCRDQQYSRHNTAYWQSKLYLGIGPGAHSYNSQMRSFNVSNNADYVRQIQSGTLPSTSEMLTKQDNVNDYILTRLRTKWGIDTQFIVDNYGIDLIPQAMEFIQDGFLIADNGVLILSKKGKLLADFISERLFV